MGCTIRTVNLGPIDQRATWATDHICNDSPVSINESALGSSDYQTT